KVVVCEDRAAGVRRLLAERQIDLILLDDAFQHRRMGRDLDLVMIDAKRLPTQDAVIPQGRLREPLLGLERADFLIVNRVDDAEQIPLIKEALARFQKPIAFCRPRMQGVQAFGEAAIQDLSWLQGKKVVAFSGIGNHPYFVERLAAAGAQVVAERRYRDHYRYREHDVKQLAALRSDEAILLTTEKDYCRLQTMVDGAPWYYVPIELDWWEGEERIWDSFCKIPSP
ncbi:MAG: tetraacyldisaccharide 4'-kinase, partial [Bacteroidota bacterium]